MNVKIYWVDPQTGKAVTTPHTQNEKGAIWISFNTRHGFEPFDPDGRVKVTNEGFHSEEVAPILKAAVHELQVNGRPRLERTDLQQLLDQGIKQVGPMPSRPR